MLKTVEVRSCRLVRPVVVQRVDKVVDVPVVQVLVVPQVQFCGYGRPCDHAATLGLANSGSASDSVHRQSLQTFQFAAETGTHSANCAAFSVGVAAVKVFSAFFGHFSRSSRSSGVERQFSEPRW